jgi:hypothetical protein
LLPRRRSRGTLTLQTGAITGTGDLTIDGLFTWTAGTISGAGTTHANGGMSLGGGCTKDVTSSRVLNVSGATTWSGVGQLRLGTGSSINNTGTWTCQSDAAMNVFSGSPVFNNNTPGIFRKAGTTGTTTVSVSFNNAASVDIQAGTVTFNGSGTHTGSLRERRARRCASAGGHTPCSRRRA